MTACRRWLGPFLHCSSIVVNVGVVEQFKCVSTSLRTETMVDGLQCVSTYFAKDRLYKPLVPKPWSNGLRRACAFLVTTLGFRIAFSHGRLRGFHGFGAFSVICFCRNFGSGWVFHLLPQCLYSAAFGEAWIRTLLVEMVSFCQINSLLSEVGGLVVDFVAGISGNESRFAS